MGREQIRTQPCCQTTGYRLQRRGVPTDQAVVVTEKVLIFSMVSPRSIALATGRVSRSVARRSEQQMQRSHSRKKCRSNDAPFNLDSGLDTGTDLVPGADPSAGDGVPSRRPTAELQRVRDGHPLAGGRRDFVSRDIKRGAAL